MIVKVKLDEQVEVKFKAEDINDLQRVISSPRVHGLMSNPVDLMSYLEINDPEFMKMAFEFAATNDVEKHMRNIQSYQLSLDTVVEYIAYVFGLPRVGYVTVEAD